MSKIVVGIAGRATSKVCDSREPSLRVVRVADFSADGVGDGCNSVGAIVRQREASPDGIFDLGKLERIGWIPRQSDDIPIGISDGVEEREERPRS